MLFVNLAGIAEETDGHAADMLRFDLGTHSYQVGSHWHHIPGFPIVYRLDDGRWLLSDGQDGKRTPREITVSNAAVLFNERPRYWAWKPGVNEVREGEPIPWELEIGGLPPELVRDLKSKKAKRELSQHKLNDQVPPGYIRTTAPALEEAFCIGHDDPEKVAKRARDNGDIEDYVIVNNELYVLPSSDQQKRAKLEAARKEHPPKGTKTKPREAQRG